jgi:hypothetical protein
VVLAKRPRAVSAFDPVGRARVGQALHDDVCCGKAVFERGGDAHELVPLLDDEGSIDRVVEQGLERPIVGTAVDPVEHLVGQILIHRENSRIDHRQFLQGGQTDLGCALSAVTLTRNANVSHHNMFESLVCEFTIIHEINQVRVKVSRIGTDRS